MKKLVLFLFLAGSVQMANAQVLISLLLGDKLNTGKIEFGLDMGVNFAQMTDFESARAYHRFNIGFYFDFKVKNNWYINTGVLVKSEVGLDKLREADVLILDPTTVFNNNGSYYQRISYFHVPVAAKYRFNNNIFVSLGPQFALRTKAYLVYEEENSLQDLTLRTDNRDLFTRLEVAAIGTAGYKLKQGEGMSIGIKYFYGFTNIFKDNYYNAKNTSLYLFVYIPVGKVKVEKKPNE